MQKIYLYFFFSIFSTILFAQNNFKEAYIITLDNDTVYGFANFRVDQQNMKECQFRIGNDKETQVFQPKDIIGYRFDEGGRFYISREVEIDSIPQNVFLEYLVKGVASLYYYTNNNKKYYFVENEKGELTSLSKTPTYYEEGQTIVDNSYMNNLYEALGNNPLMVKDINNTKFNNKSISKTISKYHSLVCSPGEECIQFESKQKSQTKIRFGIFTGFRYLDIKTAAYFPQSTIVVDTGCNGYAPEVGGLIIINNPRLTQYVSLSLGLSVYFPSKTKLEDQLGKYVFRKFTIPSVAQNLRTAIQGSYPKGKVRPTASVGIAFDNFNQINLCTSYNAGVEIIVNKKSSILLGAGYESIIGDSQQITKINQTQVKLGYIF